ncbi:MAG: hypothetical protein OSB65_07165 [Roseibacillus sp.]|nr:hypothetical protein [Roseibacillus sp.]
MDWLFATGGSEVGSELDRFGIQLALIAGVALFLGALRLWRAEGTRARLVLVVGLGLFALGMGAQNLERLGLYETSYYPGWKAEMEHDLYVLDVDVVYSEEDMGHEFVGPRWWEGSVWWGQRLARLGGMVLAIMGFVLDGREALGKCSGRPGKRKGAARS